MEKIYNNAMRKAIGRARAISPPGDKARASDRNRWKTGGRKKERIPRPTMARRAVVKEASA